MVYHLLACSTDSQRRWYHVFVWSMCVVTTIYVLAVGAHEDSDDHTCWVSRQKRASDVLL